MKIINDLHQLVRDNYDKIKALPKKPKNMHISSNNSVSFLMVYYKSKGDKIIVFSNTPEIDEFTSSLPYNEQLWIDFYNELKEEIQ